MTWNDAHIRIQEKGLYMPEVREFLIHFVNIIKSYNSQGNSLLFDAEGNPISWEETKAIYHNLVREDNPRDFHYQGGIFLDALFNGWGDLSKPSHNTIISIEQRKSVDEKGCDIITPKRKEDLESCIIEPCYVDINLLNSQGMPTKKSVKQEYNEGTNIYFYPPRGAGMGDATRFYVCKKIAYLDNICNPNALNFKPRIFGIAEGK